MITLVALLLGCQSTTYNQLGLPDNELILITKKPHEFFSNAPSAFINAIYINENQKIIEFIPLGSAIKEVKLQPGFYTFELQCNQHGRVAYPKIKIKLDKGKKYMFLCESTRKEVLFGIKTLDQAVAKVVEI